MCWASSKHLYCRNKQMNKPVKKDLNIYVSFTRDPISCVVELANLLVARTIWLFDWAKSNIF